MIDTPKAHLTNPLQQFSNRGYNQNRNTDTFFVLRPNPKHESITITNTDVQIVNLLSRNLKLLEKRLKFTPTPNDSNTQELSKDILEFTRKVRLVEYFDGVDDDNESLVRNKSNFVPPQGREELLDCFVHNTVDIPLIPNEKSNIRRNITLFEQKAISKLANDESIIIKQADKGGATVIKNKPFYQKQIEQRKNMITFGILNAKPAISMVFQKLTKAKK